MPARVLRIAAMTAGSCAVALSLRAQETFRSQVDVVPVYATVKHDSGRLVTGLTKDQFRIAEDGQDRNTVLFSSERRTLTVLLLLDVSGSMESRLLWMRQVAGYFIEALEPGDRVRIGTLGQEVAFSPHLTGDRARLTQILRDELWPGGGSPIWFALEAAPAALRGETGRLAVLLVSDGIQYANRTGVPPDVLDQFQASNIAAYAVSTRDKGLGADIKQLTEETGGGFVVLGAAVNERALMAEIAEELRQQYLLGFTPRAFDGKRHRLSIRVTAQDTTVRAQRSFFAVPGGR